MGVLKLEDKLSDWSGRNSEVYLISTAIVTSYMYCIISNSLALCVLKCIFLEIGLIVQEMTVFD